MDEMELFLKRVRELQVQGLDWGYAWEKTNLERRIEQWPSDCGDDLPILIYGDFEPPSKDMSIPELGIVINHQRQENTLAKTAMCALSASITMKDKSIDSLIDAIRRINILLGVFIIVTYGNSACGWWSLITPGKQGIVYRKLEDKTFSQIISYILHIQDESVRKKIDAALYWVKEPRNLLGESYRSDVLRVYSAYWNAFECLVEAIKIIEPLPKLSPSEKQKKIDKFIGEQIADHGQINAEDIDKCYKDLVNPGFRGKADHALTVCFSKPDQLIQEYFEMPEKRDNLYQIRNHIDHGDMMQ